MQEEKQENIANYTVPENKKLKNQKITKEFKITIQLISETSLDQNLVQGLNQDQKIEAVIQLKSIHLEWLNIRKIENLEVFTNLNILYLQHNKIAKIQHLDCLKNLQYLALNDNIIDKVEGLIHLTHLSGLNLNNNQIQDIDPKQLPSSIQLLSLKQNPVCLDANYKNDIVKHLPILEMLDDLTISPEARLKIIGKFPAHLIEYSDKMKQFRNKQQVKKQMKEDDDQKPLYLGANFQQTLALTEIRQKTTKYMHQAQQTFKKDTKEQNQNFQSKIKVSRKIRNFKKEHQSSKHIRMSQITETAQEQHQQN